MPHPTLKRAASAGGASDKMHSAGAFVAKITAAADYEQDGYMQLQYALQQPDGTFQQYEWSMDFRSYYLSKWDGPTQFEKLMTAIEECNPGFDMEAWQRTWNARELVGKHVGLVFRDRIYTGNDGSDRTRPELVFACSIKRVKDGIETPKPRDTRAPKAEPVKAYEPAVVEADVYDIDIPF